MNLKIDFQGIWPGQEIAEAREHFEWLYDKLPYDANWSMVVARGRDGYRYALKVASIAFEWDGKGEGMTFPRLCAAVDEAVLSRITRWHHHREVDL